MILALVAILVPCSSPLEDMFTAILSHRATATSYEGERGQQKTPILHERAFVAPRETEGPSPGTQVLAMIYTSN